MTRSEVSCRCAERDRCMYALICISAYTHTPTLAHMSTGIGVKGVNTRKIHRTPIRVFASHNPLIILIITRGEMTTKSVYNSKNSAYV